MLGKYLLLIISKQAIMNMNKRRIWIGCAFWLIFQGVAIGNNNSILVIEDTLYKDNLHPTETEINNILYAWQAEKEGNTSDAILYYKNFYGSRPSYLGAFALLRLFEISLAEGNKTKALKYLSSHYEMLNKIRLSEENNRNIQRLEIERNKRKQQKKLSSIPTPPTYFSNFSLSVIVICSSIFGICALLLMWRYMYKKLRIKRIRTKKIQIWRNDMIASSMTKEHLPVHARLLQKLDSNAIMDSSDWIEVEKEVEKKCPEFKNKLLDMCKLSEHEYHVCLLLRLKMRPSEIAVLTSHSIQAITSTRKRLYVRATQENGLPSQWDTLIKGL